MRTESSPRWFSTHCVSTRTSLAYSLISASVDKTLESRSGIKLSPRQSRRVYSALSMERAPLRPIPVRPAGPVHPLAATRALGAAIPELSPRQADAVALVALAGRSRPRRPPSSASERRSSPMRSRAGARRCAALCSRSARAAGASAPSGSSRTGSTASSSERGAARLDVHLRNCPRCVEHERRLVQATDALVARAAGAAPSQIDPAMSSAQLTVVATAQPTPPAEPRPTPRRVANARDLDPARRRRRAPRARSARAHRRRDARREHLSAQRTRLTPARIASSQAAWSPGSWATTATGMCQVSAASLTISRPCAEQLRARRPGRLVDESAHMRVDEPLAPASAGDRR